MASSMPRRTLLGAVIASGVAAWVGPTVLNAPAVSAAGPVTTDLVVNGGFEDLWTGWRICDPNRACLEPR